MNDHLPPPPTLALHDDETRLEPFRSARLPLPGGGLLEVLYRILPDRHQGQAS